jgi:lipid-A-disaccharide synthase
VQEVKRKLPVMARAAQAIRRELPDASFVVPCAGEEQLRVAEDILARYDLPVRAFEGKTYEVMKEADFCIATSGTVTLELMHFNAPMAVIYRINWASYLIARTFMRTKFIAMPNVLAGREVVFDRLLWRDSPEEIAGAALDVIRSPARRDEVRSALRELRQKFDHPGAAHQAAQAIVRFAEQYRGHVSDGGSQWPE